MDALAGFWGVKSEMSSVCMGLRIAKGSVEYVRNSSPKKSLSQSVTQVSAVGVPSVVNTPTQSLVMEAEVTTRGSVDARYTKYDVQQSEKPRAFQIFAGLIQYRTLNDKVRMPAKSRDASNRRAHRQFVSNSDQLQETHLKSYFWSSQIRCAITNRYGISCEKIS